MHSGGQKTITKISPRTDGETKPTWNAVRQLSENPFLRAFANCRSKLKAVRERRTKLRILSAINSFKSVNS